MKAVLLGLLAVFLGLAAYLAFWPVPIDPAAWEAPVDRGYVGDYAPNTDLQNLRTIDLSPHHGPEDIVALPDGRLLTATQEGFILSVDPQTAEVTELANTGGIPLGLEMEPGGGRLLVADALKGLVAVGLDGTVEVLTDTVDGTPILYADDLDIAPDGTVYFSDASVHGPAEYGTTMDASLIEIMESRGTGRLLAYDPATKQTRVVSDGYVFNNGIAIAPDGDVLMNVTGRYQMLKVDPETGEERVLIDNFPGFPDNINPGPVLADGTPTYFVGIVSPRSEWLDENSGNVFMRRLAMRLPPSMRPQAQAYGLILQVDADGNVLKTWHDPDGKYLTPTGAVQVGGRIYVTSLLSPTLGYLETE